MARLLSRSAFYLGASLGATIVSLAVLPFATQVIGPLEYGALALAVGVATLLTALAQAAQGYVLPEYLPRLGGDSRSELISSALIAVVVVAAVATALLSPLVFVLAPLAFDLSDKALLGIQICLVATFLAAPWVVCVDVLMLEGRALPFALATVGQSVVNGVVVLVLLFAYPHPDLALFCGYAAGQMTLLVTTMAVLGRRLVRPSGGRWFQEMRRSAVAVGRASLTETGRTLFERSYLGTWSGMGSLGLYAHAQLYRNSAMTMLNAVSRAILPINLREARQTDLRFAVTYSSWVLVQSGVALGCVAFALFGREVIALLTSGKFVEATPIALVFLLALLIQTAAKREQCLMIAGLKGAQLSNSQAVATLVGVVVIAAFVPLFGAPAAAGAFVVQVVLHRILVFYYARRLARLVPRESWVVVGTVVTVAAYVWNITAEPSMTVRAIAFVVATGVVCALCWRAAKFYFLYDDTDTTAEADAAGSSDSMGVRRGI